MDANLFESYLDNIAELVADEDKIVTYKFLSKHLGIHVNTAKQLLYTYLTLEKSKNAFPISATYLLAGKTEDGSFNISVVNEVDLANMYSKFVQITSEHVYSIQKGKCLKEIRMLCGINKDVSHPELPPVIKCSKSSLRQKKEIKKNVNYSEEQNKKVVKEAFAPKKEAVDPSKKTESVKNTEKTSKSPKKTSPKSQANDKKQVGSLANLFAKAAERGAGQSVKTDKNNLKDLQKDVEKCEKPSEARSVQNKESEDSKETSSNGNSESVTKSRSSPKRKRSGNRRKRIRVLSDSENDDSSNEEPSPEEEDSLPSVTCLEEEKEEVKQTVAKNKRKKRKVVDKTVMNEDGYLETKKEIVFETDSEPEAEETTSKEQKKPTSNFGNDVKGAQNANAAKKQSSLLTFFKKA